ncbi:MAG: hypothetical protein IKE81_12520 [Clostridia bacterium]|nr:hypothetical protein [Clostridia bacterium]
MTIQEIKNLLTGVDPDAQRYEHDRAGTGEAYTVWAEIGPVGFYGDGQEQGSIHFQVDRFTKVEDEVMAECLRIALEDADYITVDYRVDYEQDTGWIHHIFDCEGV